MDCVPPLDDYCFGNCVDTDSDPDYCGDCVTSCGANEICVGGQCVGPNLAWTLVGQNPIDRGVGAIAHDLATEGTQPTAAWVTPHSGGFGGVIVGIGGTPYVAFREGSMMDPSQSLYVKHYVVP